MTKALQFIFSCFSKLISVLDYAVFEIYDFRVSLWSLIFAFIVISIFANVWWRGAKG